MKKLWFIIRAVIVTIIALAFPVAAGVHEYDLFKDGYNLITEATIVIMWFGMAVATLWAWKTVFSKK